MHARRIRWSIAWMIALVGATAVRPAGAGAVVARTSVVRAPPPRNVTVVHRSSYYGPAPGAVAAVTVITAVAIGAVVASLPPSCATVVSGGVTYQHCGNTWYRPQYSGTELTYVVVAPP